MQPKFVVISGMDFSGKDTQFKELQRIYGNDTFFYTREPGSPHHPLTRAVREHLLQSEAPGSVDEIFDLFWADRGAHLRNVVQQALARGLHVISNRGDSDTFVYQGVAEEREDLQREFFLRRRKYRNAGLPFPDAYIFYLISNETLIERMKGREDERNHFDDRSLEFHERVRRGYYEFSGRYFSEVPHGIHVIDGSKSIQEVTAETVVLLDTIFRA